ncbi:sigma factor-like helix-turn-helix DNA-binding protein [Streptomyces sp. 8N706]|uniref:sigma factor-like helix-turn-helix DNA-binding protein n=1 Tax=Streptomyces sp. 8N706 TaxID=3457416 RepID=UPI003FD532D6
MRERRAEQDRRRAREFEAFVAGAAGRLLHAATLLTGDQEAAERLLTDALARTYAMWDRLHGEDPYDRARQELATRFAHAAWHHRRARGGLLGRLTPQERLVLVLRLYEGVPEEQCAAQLGVPTERVRALCLRSMATLRSRPAAGPAVHPAVRPAVPLAGKPLSTSAQGGPPSAAAPATRPERADGGTTPGATAS